MLEIWKHVLKKNNEIYMYLFVLVPYLDRPNNVNVF